VLVAELQAIHDSENLLKITASRRRVSESQTDSLAWVDWGLAR